MGYGYEHNPSMLVKQMASFMAVQKRSYFRLDALTGRGFGNIKSVIRW